jgi:hypothetical protein
MKLGRILLLSILTLIAIGALDLAYEGVYIESLHSSEAVFKIPGISAELVLERRGTHLFLAEYERTLILRVGLREIMRQEAAADTGGYSRMNVYQISPSEYFLSGELSYDRYSLDMSVPAINKATLEEKPANSRFIGCFDHDEEGWRFIPEPERVEQKSKLE